MTDDATHGGGPHIPTPAEVHHDHPTVLVPVPPDEDAVRRIETHDGGTRVAGSDATGNAATGADASAVGAVATERFIGEDTAARPSRDTAEVTPRPTVDGPATTDSPVVDLEFSSEFEPESEVLAQAIADAASTVPGVHALGSPAARAVDSARASLLGRTSIPGVNVLEDDDVLNVAVSLVAEYPAIVTEVADSVRADVASVLEGRHDGPVDIDVTVTDVHGPFDPVEPSDRHPGSE
ncbi:Asp23/Gls24 family envelope stress response protein [Labedella endophytica]|uniref:Asp23/Gls24 family envelope stress response protein n=1 Tax=Labedella endophytica TaxID=1523160 RepID=A0A3S1CU18_9MICO|nr:Asp23/Gls24 family envelope stress response protein [Labedella endophytica]RUR03072.1 Asp23/Gls24 family envelope stress response protein [Labedella endophytica]